MARRLMAQIMRPEGRMKEITNEKDLELARMAARKNRATDISVEAIPGDESGIVEFKVRISGVDTHEAYKMRRQNTTKLDESGNPIIHPELGAETLSDAEVIKMILDAATDEILDEDFEIGDEANF
jgi:hypothetical protein